MWDADTSAAVGAAAQVATAVIALAAAGFAWRQVSEARTTREAQAQPFVVVDIEPGRVWMNWLTLVVENVGSTLARDVQVTFDPPLTTAAANNGLTTSALLRDGIAALPPGRRIETMFDLSHERHERGLPMRYEVTVSFCDARGRKQHPLPYVIDLSYLYDLDPVRADSMHDLVGEVRRIRAEVEGWRAGGRGVLVRRPADDRREKADGRWQYALTGTRKSLSHPGLHAGFGWPARLPLVREPWHAWRTRRAERLRQRQAAAETVAASGNE